MLKEIFEAETEYHTKRASGLERQAQALQQNSSASTKRVS